MMRAVAPPARTPVPLGWLLPADLAGAGDASKRPAKPDSAVKSRGRFLLASTARYAPKTRIATLWDTDLARPAWCANRTASLETTTLPLASDRRTRFVHEKVSREKLLSSKHRNCRALAGSARALQFLQKRAVRSGSA